MRQLLTAALIALLMNMTLVAGEAQPDPAEYFKQAMGGRLNSVKYGEQFCWVACYGAGQFVQGYKAYKNPEWLAEGEKYFDFCITKLQKDPDGYEGWIGPHIGQEKKKNEYVLDSVVGDAIMCVKLLGWAEVVLNDPKLKQRFGAKAEKYVTLSARICWEKFNKRGQAYECAAGWVSYSTPNKLINAKTWKWESFPRNVISNNLNKHYDLALALVKLWRITGKSEYKERAKKVFGRAKSMWRYYKKDDRVVWNFWMPHGPYDIEGKAPRSWVSVHHARSGYQAGECAMFLEVYDSGLVFTKKDFERIVNTNLWMSKTGSGTKGWKNAEGGKAGQLWSCLARLNPELAKRHEAGIAKARGIRGQIARAYYENVTKKQGWDRLYAKTVDPKDIVNVPLKDGEFLSMTQVIPNRIELANEDVVQLVTKVRKEGILKIDLLDKDGKTPLGNLFTLTLGKNAQYEAPMWDGTVPGGGKKAGQYTVRWSFAGDVRTEPVWVVQGTKKKTSGPAVIKKGETIKEDFEGDLSPRWVLENSAKSSAQKHGGAGALEVKRNALFMVGKSKRQDLPVKITMWVYDSGAKMGKKTGNGPAWGVMTAVGDKFCMRQCWRRYLSGDKDYVWINTGENQWFSPHPSKAGRTKGWHEWVFDFSTSPATVSQDGKALGTLSAKFTPKGCVAVYLQNGSPGGPLYVDDITVEYK